MVIPWQNKPSCPLLPTTSCVSQGDTLHFIPGSDPCRLCRTVCDSFDSMASEAFFNSMMGAGWKTCSSPWPVTGSAQL